MSYVPPPTGTPPGPVPEFTVTYNDIARAVEIQFASPLEAFREVRVELREGITAIDGQPL